VERFEGGNFSVHFANHELNDFRFDLTPPSFQRTGLGAAHLLKEMVVVRFDGGADCPSSDKLGFLT